MIVILLPAYNEEVSLPALLPKIDRCMRQRDADYRLIICDDGSTDSTAGQLVQFSQRYPLDVIRHELNRGLGETIRDLFERAARTSQPNDVIVRMDCDDTHDPEHIHALVEALDEGYDVAAASRFQPGGGQRGFSVYRRLLSRAANLFMKMFFPIRGMQDYSSGFRAYRASAIQAAIRFFENDFIQLKGLGFTCTLEKLIKLKILGATFREVPFVLRYDRKQSSSKMVSSVTTMGYLVMVVLYHWPWGGWRRRYKRRPKPALRAGSRDTLNIQRSAA